MNRLNTKASLLSALVVLSLAIVAGPGQAQTRRTHDPLGRLKDALQEASATALTSAQETSLTTLITNFQTAHETRPTPSTAEQNARAAYDTAILNQDSAGAAAQAAIIATEQGVNSLQRQKDLANFGIEVVKVLRSGGDLVAPLITRFGSNGAARLILSLAGGPGFGPGGPGPRGPRSE
jgi:hypothetical protein